MLETVDVGTQSIACYETSAGAEVVSQLRELAAPLAGARVLHLNATPYGGGVAGILRSEVPLLRDLGLAADWRVIAGDAAFFNTTKAIHNGLQGAARDITPDEQTAYLDTAGRNAKQLDVAGYDLIVAHDPQPLAMLQFAGKVLPAGCGAATLTPPSHTRRCGLSCVPICKPTTQRSSPSADSRHRICLFAGSR